MVVFEDVTPLREAADAERAARAWTERLQVVTAAIGGALTAPEVTRVAAEHGAAAVGAPSGGVWAPDAAGAADLAAESAPGAGSTFTLTLPRGDAPAA